MTVDGRAGNPLSSRPFRDEQRLEINKRLGEEVRRLREQLERLGLA
jgi:hypothetical protein